MVSNGDRARESAGYIQKHCRYEPSVGLVLGSGLGTLADRVKAADIIPYGDIPHFVTSTVEGHAGRMVLGRLGRSQVCLLQGRLHYYEGYSPAEITLPIRVMQALGVRILIVTNAAGGLRPDLEAGDLMAITDQINFVGMAGHSPLRGGNDDSLGPRFPDMARAYDPDLLDLAREQATELGISLQEGVYVMVAGPNFETPAEVRLLRILGADAVGMSTVPEVIVARHGGMRVLGISLISNVAIDAFREQPRHESSHQEVLAAGQRAVPSLAALLEAILQHLN